MKTRDNVMFKIVIINTVGLYEHTLMDLHGI